jgi:hypothetical protein
VQLVADLVAMVPLGKTGLKDGSYTIFSDTVTAGKPLDIRVTGDPETAGVIAGLDEGLSTMRVGGIRRLYIPGTWHTRHEVPSGWRTHLYMARSIEFSVVPYQRRKSCES